MGKWIVLLLLVVYANGCTGYIAKESASAEDFPGKNVSNDNQGTAAINFTDQSITEGNQSINESINETKPEETNEADISPATENRTWVAADLCAGRNCGVTSITCPDSYIASCNNTCINGNCEACTPSCSGHELNHVIFSEIMYDTSTSGEKDEWLELYNPSGADISLAGWTISDNSRTWKFSDITISRKSYLVIAKNATAFQQSFNCAPHVSGFSRTLNNDGDQLTLKDGSGNEIDFVAWEKGANDAYPAWDLAAKQGKSLARKALNDSDIAADWSAGTPQPDC